MISVRLAERYLRLRTLQATSSPNEAAVARSAADALATAHDLSLATLRAHVPRSGVLFGGGYWWGIGVLDALAAFVGADGGLTTDWVQQAGDSALVVAGARLQVDRVRMLYAATRLGFALGLVRLRPRLPLQTQAFADVALKVLLEHLRRAHPAPPARVARTAMVLWAPRVPLPRPGAGASEPSSVPASTSGRPSAGRDDVARGTAEAPELADPFAHVPEDVLVLLLQECVAAGERCGDALGYALALAERPGDAAAPGM
jgi:hypothetical protein